MFKQEKGVTLVALIITIIVLLILAGVSFAVILGDNGILNRAQKSGEVWNDAVANEKETMDNAANEMNRLIDALTE